jgi:hypothetical protein
MAISGAGWFILGPGNPEEDPLIKINFPHFLDFCRKGREIGHG